MKNFYNPTKITVDYTPIANLAKITSPWSEVLFLLTTPNTENVFSFGISQIDKLVLAYMAKLEWDSRIKIIGIPPDEKEYIYKLGNLTHKLLLLINAVFLVTPLNYYHPASIFLALFREREAIFYAISGETKSGIITQQQNINQQLRNLENPFTRKHTQSFFAAAIKLAEQNDNWRKQYYLPFYKSRMELVTYIKTPHVAAVVKDKKGFGNIARQGKKKNQNKSLAR
ncbi:MAG: hypothetical protein EA365_08795 [Gloeocapsa sp. DLM2.Bin57]|nr:MAG: hypothetical protein EA365_08795 [Gloeocapsa sp. DLM2.Bin57]